MPRRNLSFLLAGIVFCLICHQRDENDPYARYVAEGFEKIDDEAFDDVPEQLLFEGAMRGMVAVLQERGDPHSGFVPQQRKQVFDEEFDQQFGGINVRLRPEGDPPHLVIATPLSRDSPARIAGMLPGDVLMAVDGDPIGPITNAEFARVLRQVRGRPGKEVEITVQRPGEDGTRNFRIVREIVVIEAVEGDIRDSEGQWRFRLPDDPRIALVRVGDFGKKTAGELAATLERLTGEGVEAVVLDLRHNPGGPLKAGRQVCELFLRSGQPIYEIRNREKKAIERLHAGGDGPFVDLPLAVLLDSESASASELVAGCLKGNGRAAIVGQRSFGKGTVQQLIPVQAGKSYLKITSSTFWPPSGSKIHRPIGDEVSDKWGIDPTEGLAVAMTPEEQQAWFRARLERDSQVSDDPDNPPLEDYEDRVLNKAAEFLRNELGPPTTLNSDAESAMQAAE